MNTNAFDGGKFFRLVTVLPVIIALTCIILWATLFARIADQNIGIDKDWLYIYLCGIETVHPTMHEQQIELVKNIVSASANDQIVYRATLRANYCNNYSFTSLSMYIAGKWQTYFGVSPAEDFSTFLARTLWFGIIVSGEALGILCLLVTFIVTNGALRLALFITVGLGALFYLTVPAPSLNWILYQSTPVPPARLVNWPNILGVSLYSWINPGAAYSAFSVFARCLCALLAFTAFAIRWSGRPNTAYWVPLLVSAVHQSSAFILLFVLTSCDIVIRPRVFARVRYILPIGLTLLVIFLRERMFSILGFSSSDGVLAVAIFLGLALGVAMFRSVRATIQAGWSFIAGWRSRTIEAVPLPFADALIIFAGWFVLLAVSYLASRNDAWYRLIYFWSELPSRYVGMFQLSVFAGIIYPLVAMMQSVRPTADRAVTIFVAALMLIMAASQLTQERTGLASAIRAARSYETTSLKKDVYAGSTAPAMRDETMWYYLLLRSAILGDRSVSSFFGKT